MDEKYRSRKFYLAVFFALMATVGLFTGHLEGGAYVGVVTSVLMLYGAANVAEKRNGG